MVLKIPNLKFLNKRKIILASSSPRRIKLLKEAGLNFKVKTSNLNEELLLKKINNLSFENLVKLLSLLKAILVVNTACKDEIIIAFDTVVVCKNKVLGKPKNKKDALKKILFLGNCKHKVLTGIAIVDLRFKKVICDFDVTEVTMKKISKEEALAYVKTKEPLDKAGAYAIQGKGSKFVKSISGDYFNVVGLPLKKFFRIVKSI